MVSEQHLIWIDCEMTGLNVARDVILEVACLITDNNLQLVAHGPSLVIHQSDETLSGMNDWCKKQHALSGLIEDVRTSCVTLEQAEQELLNFVKRYCKPETSPLCGNTVYQDRIFLRKYMATFDAFAHYRLIDISTIKELARRWYPDNSKAWYTKPEVHRAMNDIEASVEELKWYREYFFK